MSKDQEAFPGMILSAYTKTLFPIWIHFRLSEVRKVKSGAGNIPSLPRVLEANLLLGSALEQLNEESLAVPVGLSGLVVWAGG